MLRSQASLLLERRWVATAGLSLDQLTAWGILYYAYTVLSVPMAADLGLSRTFVAGAFSACLLTRGWLAPRVGRWSDRRGAREVLVPGAVLGGFGMLGLATVQGPIGVLLAFLVLGVAQSMSLYEPAFQAIVGWFPEPHLRSRALLVLTCVGGFASTVFVPATALLVSYFEWRITVVVFAGALALLVAPARLLLPKLPTSSRSSRPQADQGMPQPRSATWLSLAFALQAFASTGVSIYLVWHQVEQGQTLAAAAMVAGLAGAAQVPGRLLVVVLHSRLPIRRRLPLLLLVQAAAIAVVVSASGPLALGGVLVFGAASGMMTLERATVVVQWYGAAGFGVRSGRLVAVAMTAKAAAPLVVQAGHQWASYDAIFGGLACLFLVSAGLVMVAVVARQHETQPSADCSSTLIASRSTA